jgi:hypothetical protein
MIEIFRPDQVEQARAEFDRSGHVCIDGLYSALSANAITANIRKQRLKPTGVLGEQKLTTLQTKQRAALAGSMLGDAAEPIANVADALGYPGWPYDRGSAAFQTIAMASRTNGIRHTDDETGLIAVTNVQGASFLEFDGHEPYLITAGRVVFHDADRNNPHRGFTTDQPRLGVGVFSRVNKGVVGIAA